MKFTVMAIGTRGDVEPAIVIGKALQRRGHQVRLFASASFRSWIEGHGLEAGATRVNIQELMETEGGVDWVERGHNPLVQARIMKGLLDRVGWELVWDAWQACQGTDAILSSFTSDTYMTAVAEKLSVPQISIPLQPALIASREGPAVMNAPLPNRRSRINFWFSKAFIEPYPWQIYGDLTVRLRRELGLPPQSARENTAVRKSLLTLQAFSPRVVPSPRDWPPNVHTTGYWFLDEQADWQPPEALKEFLEAGPAPVYIGFGSMTGRDPYGMTRLILKGVRLSGVRALLGSGWAGLGGSQLPDSVYLTGAVPHRWLFPRLVAVVHHGGAGTTAAGLRAGVPSLIVPHFVDQPYWGRRVQALGVGPAPVPRHKLTAEKLADGIRRAVSDSDMQARAAALGAAIRSEDGPGVALRLLEGRYGV